MSGHNKWSTIKHKKAREDAKRGRIFTRLIKEITVAARMGGGDPDGNPRLRAAITAARAANMPSDNIDRGIKRGTGELEGVEYEEVLYEGYAPHGVAVLVECLTDNRTRTVAEVRHVFHKYGGSLAEPNAVAWQFDRLGRILVGGTPDDEEDVMMAAIEAGAEDVSWADEGFEVLTTADGLFRVQAGLEEQGLTIQEAGLTYVAKTSIEIGERESGSVGALLEKLDDCDDVQNLYANATLPG